LKHNNDWFWKRRVHQEHSTVFSALWTKYFVELRLSHPISKHYERTFTRKLHVSLTYDNLIHTRRPTRFIERYIIRQYVLRVLIFYLSLCTRDDFKDNGH